MLLFLAIRMKSTELYDKASAFALSVEETESGKVDSAYAESLTHLERTKKNDESLNLMRRWFEGKTTCPCIETYLTSRGYHANMIPILVNSFDLRYDTSEGRLLIPMYSTYTNELLSVQGRAVDSTTSPKYRHYLGSRSSTCFATSLNKSIFDADVKTAIIVEGPFDAMKMFSYQIQALVMDEEDYFDVIFLGVSKSKISTTQADILGKAFKPVYSMLDSDEAGKRGNMQIVDRLEGKIPKGGVIELPEGVKDPDGLSFEQFKEIIRRVR